jgi:hypothetical protein
MAKVPRGLEPDNLPLAGLSESSGGVYGPRVDHDKAKHRSSDLGKFGRAFLWLLGRRKRDVGQDAEE